jgi:hypothetical protein
MLLSMESDQRAENVSFGARLSMAFRLIFDAAFAREVAAGLKSLVSRDTKPAAPKVAPTPADGTAASGLFILGALQREGRLLDFLQQDVSGYSDEEVGAAARVVHAGCGKVVQQYFTFQPALAAAEGSTVTVPPGFDAQRIRLTGNVTGKPPFKGALKHHGWIATEIRLPRPDALDPKIVAPAEVELA